MTTSCGSRLPRSWRKRLWLPGRQPSSRWRVEALSVEQLRSRTASLDVERSAPPRARPPPAARRPSRSARRARRAAAARPAAVGLLVEQRDDARDGRRLAGAGSAGDDGEAAQHGGRGGERAGGRRLVAGEQPCEAVGEHGRVDVAGAARCRARGGRRRPGAPRASSGRGRASCRRGAAAGSSPPSSPTATSGLAASRSIHALGVRPRQRREVDRPRRRRPSRCRGSWRGRRRRGRAGARGRRAPPRAHLLVVLARRAPRAGSATWTSAAASTPASLKSRSSPVRAASRGGRRTDRVVTRRAHVAASAVEHVAERLDERRRRPPGEDAARLPSTRGVSAPDHPAQEQVEDAGEVRSGS